MGFVFPQNFDRPYRARSFRDFWRRWHMTLSRFLRDFLYIPLGGNRGGRWRTARNLMITMLLGGLWHGAAWSVRAVGRPARRRRSCVEHALRGRAPRLPAWLRWASPSTSSCLAWILFRAADLDTAWAFCQRLVTPGPSTLLTPGVARGGPRRDRRSSSLPERPLERCASASRRSTRRARRRPGGRHRARRRRSVPSQGVPPFIYFRF